MISRRAAALTSLVALTACGGGDDSVPEPSREPVTSWIGETLEGGTVVIVADDSTGFVGDVPSAVDAILGVTECESLLGAIEFWSSRMGDPSAHDRASAYVVVARDRLAQVGCSAATGG